MTGNSGRHANFLRPARCGIIQKMSLNLLQVRDGEEATITAIDHGAEFEKKIERLGIRVGTRLRKISSFGPVLVEIGSGKVALGRKMAARIQVVTKHSRVLLFGNPNVGKSVVFSRLTGTKVISANYAGTTVEYTKGYLFVQKQRVEVIDVPGAYTLEATCTAEEIAREFCTKEQADLIVNVVDATNLERNLYLTLQLLGKGIPMIVVLNKSDIAKRQGIQIDMPELARRLGVPVLPIVAVTSQGFSELTEKIAQAMNGQIEAPEFKAIDHQETWNMIGHISQEVQKIVHHHPSFLERLEAASVKPLFASLMALLVMALSFFLIRVVGEGLINYVFDPFFRRVYGPLVIHLVKLIPLPLLQKLLIGQGTEFMQSFGALTTGVYVPLALVLPYIISFYLVFGFLEDFGYLPRLAVLMDRLMHHIGLHGYAALPLLISCGCKVPAVLSLRILESKREKFLALILLMMAAPCLPQSAMIVSLVAPFGFRYVVLIFAVLACVALINSLILNLVIKGESPEIIMEIPAYQLPHFPTLLSKLWLRVKIFLSEAAPVIVLGILVVNVLQIIGLIDFLGRMAQPLTTHILGLPQETAAIIMLGFLRKDVSIAMLMPLHLDARQAVIACVFLVLYMPCLATFFVALKEAGGKVAVRLVVLTFTWATLAGWILKIIL
jgi:ferrous iron transport protein B